VPSKNDPLKDHSHYGSEVQDALLAFQSIWTSYMNMTWLQLRDNPARIDSVQTAWNILARARKKETGSGFYVNAEQHRSITESKAS
tara:strand:- start:546 stop:803 length:258 start_codon:yes stop_codon:yes gene_type:complete